MAYWKLIRPRIIVLVLLSMMVAAWTAGREPPPWPLLVHVLAGTALVIAGAIALNQRMEAGGDAKMARTAGRPLPSGRLSARQVTCFGIAISAAGLAYLAFFSQNYRLVALAAVSWAIYLGTYTPLKSRTAWQTPVGALAGAMPVLLGAATAGALASPTALCLFGIVYFWQFPHAMAIAWLYRQQFAAADVKLATVLDPSGHSAGMLAVLGAAILLPVSITPTWFAWWGWPYACCALAAGLAYLVVAVAFWLRPEDLAARWLLRASLVYLPVIFAAMLLSPGKGP
jgi:heme o synthase